MIIKIQKKKLLGSLSIAVLIVMSLSMLSFVNAQAEGATITYLSNSSKNASIPGSRNDEKGAIHTIILDTEQQNNGWKAYVGNVSSVFVLDDADAFSIYQWSIDSFDGQVYITRNSSISWDNVECASAFNKTAEDSRLNHDSTIEDSINRSFTLTAHKSFSIGTRSVSADICFSLATNQNDTAQTASATTPFTEILLWDNSTDIMIFTTFVETDVLSYRNDTDGSTSGGANATYDFQAIVPDDNTLANPPVTYYFYLELS